LLESKNKKPLVTFAASQIHFCIFRMTAAYHNVVVRPCRWKKSKVTPFDSKSSIIETVQIPMTEKQ
jgi:hypothetical protein